jgi:very-short-patch-repair endonuclease
MSQPLNGGIHEADVGSTSPTMSASDIAKTKLAIYQARRELLDPSRRNRLLHAPLTGKRPWCMAIVDRDPDEIFRKLCRQESFRGYSFEPSGEQDQEANEHDQKPPGTIPGPTSRIKTTAAEMNGGSTRPRLQTKLTTEKLERRLTKIFREERTLEEEQGVSTLYLALGFLKWFESDQSEEPSLSPLILAPVTMTRVRGSDGYALSGRDEEIVINVSLREKLRADFGVMLPEIPENDGWTPSAYCTAVAGEVARYRRWQVQPECIGLGFFTFSKFMMWRDLDATGWPQNGLLSHSILNVLLGEESVFEDHGPLVAEDELIDPRIDIAKAVHVVDADSSQSVVIEEALRGRNLVVQGPPGTGKSQTITNIIAAAVHSGKSVLFVAEKTAALAVVHDRLARAGLDALCLEMHSRKANKRAVLKSLEEALRLSGGSRCRQEIAERLASCRDQLNGWSKTVHRPISQTGRTPFEIMGRQLQLRADNVRLLPDRIEHVADWPAETLLAAEAALDRAVTAIVKLGGAPSQHPWYGTKLPVQSPFDLERLADALHEAIEKIGTLSGRLTRIYSNIVGAGIPCLADAFLLVNAFHHLLVAPEPGRSALVSPAWTAELDKLLDGIDQCERFTRMAAEINALFERDAWTFDTATVLLCFKVDGQSFFGRFSRRYRQAVAALRGICRQNPPKSLAERAALVHRLESAQEARRDIAAISTYVQSALGPIWANTETRWQDARALAAWTRAALSGIGVPQIIVLAARSADLSAYADYASGLESAAREADATLQQVLRAVEPDSGKVFGLEEPRQIPLEKLLAKLTTWHAQIAAANDWVAAREALERLRGAGLGGIADLLITGDLNPVEARPAVDLLIAEALWRRASHDDPGLTEIDGASRSEHVTEFRELDRRRIQSARQEVLARYLDGRPAGHQGAMGIIRAEIGKKRGHRAVRKLMLDAGAAVQRLKPVFLMSPLSVAQFVPPGHLTFDLLVIDEASQVAPEDALGVIARARQIIVVGDHHQLPPTNFFKTVSAGGDEEDNEGPEANAMRPSHYESILTLARSRGMHERMLAWHYRSRHPSLIALSNAECYAGRLLLPPSPFVQTTEFGLSLVRTPRGFYDRGGTSRDLVQAEEVAKAIAQQIKKHPNKSLGVACLSAQQRDAVDDMIDKLGLRTEVEAFSPKDERLFVKNLEAVQGDERDVILISVGYGVGPDQSRPFLNFGPVSREGGERRLNVLASRAREKCIVFSSITAADVPADSPARGTRMLRGLLHFAETGKLGAGTLSGGDFESPFEESVARAIREAGYQVHSQVGVSSFRIDLGVIHPTRPGEYLLGVECDGATYHRARSARDRDRLRQEVLEALGWRLFRIWSTDWFRNPANATDRLLSAIRDAENRTSEPVDLDAEDEAISIPSTLDEAAAPEEADQSHTDSGTEYKECSLVVPYGRSLLDLGTAEVGRLALVVVEAEGPVHTEEVARRIREAFGLQRTGNRILKHVRDALMAQSRTGTIRREQEFWTIAGREIQEIRMRRTAALPLRRASMIAPGEYHLAILRILEEAVTISREDLGVETARQFGFDRTGHDFKEEINRQISVLVKAGKIDFDGSVVRPPSVSLDHLANKVATL